jgi:NADPH-dependent curcumin reductase CurA
LGLENGALNTSLRNRWSIKMTGNRQWRLVSKPVGLVDETNLKLVTEPLGAPGRCEVQLKLIYISLDPGI